MKKFSNLLGTLKSTIKKIKDPSTNTDSTSTFFKKVEAYDINNGSKVENNTTIADKIPQLDRVVLKGTNQMRVLAKIEEIIFRSKSNYIPEHVKDACEIVHYHIINGLPVRVTLVKTILPDLDIKKGDVIDEGQYDEWLRYKHNMDATDSTIEIEDTFGMNAEGGRGKKHHENWKVNPESHSDTWKKH